MSAVFYSPGEAWAVVVANMVLVVDSGEPELIADLWQACRADGSTLVEVLDILGRPGLGRLPAFAGVMLRDSKVHGFARGTMSIELSGSAGERTWEGQQVSTWAERTDDVSGISRVRVKAAAALGAEVLPLLSGVARAGVVDLYPAGCAPMIAPEPGEVGPNLGADAFDPEESYQPVDLPEAVEEPTPGDEPTGFYQEADEPESESEPDAVPVVPAEVAEESAAAPEENSMDVLFGATIPRLPEDAAVRPVAEPQPGLITGPPPGLEASATPPDELDQADEPVDPFGGDHDGKTVFGRLATPPPPPPPSPVPAPHKVTARLVLSTGETVDVSGPVLVGRAPQTRNAPLDQIPRLVTVHSPSNDISRTHLEFLVEDDSLIVRDVSSNGTIMTRPGQAPTRMGERASTLLTLGTVLDLGDGVTIRIEAGRS